MTRLVSCTAAGQLPAKLLLAALLVLPLGSCGGSGAESMVPRLRLVTGEAPFSEEERQALGSFELDDPGTLAGLVDALEHPDAEVRRGAVEVLRQRYLRSPAVAAVGPLLQDSSPMVRASAFGYLISMDSRAVAAAESVVAVAMDPNQPNETRLKAFAILRAHELWHLVPPESLWNIAEAKEEVRDLRVAAAGLIRELPESEYEGVLAGLATAPSADRAVYFSILSALTDAPPSRVEALLTGLAEEDAECCLTAARGLARHAADETTVRRALRDRLIRSHATALEFDARTGPGIAAHRSLLGLAHSIETTGLQRGELTPGFEALGDSPFPNVRTIVGRIVAGVADE